MGQAPTEWRVPEDDPRAWARGKTATELLTLTDQAVQSLYQVATMPQQQQYQPPPPNNELDDDEIIDGKRLKAILAGQAPRQETGGSNAQMAQMALSMAQSQHPEAFRKWGPEILANVGQLPVQMRDLDNISRIVRMVRADHVDEIAEERARTIAANSGLSVRTNGAAPGYPGGPSGGALSLESEELPVEYRDRLKSAGVTEAQARSFCAANGITFKEWVAQAKNIKNLIGEE